MSAPNFDHFESNWEDFPGNEGSFWGESQWRNYLKGSDRDTARYLAFYNSLKDKPNHLDEVAIQMGWDAQDVSLTDAFNSPEIDDENADDSDENAPYTLHKHPVIIVSRSLYRYLNESWEHFIMHRQTEVSPQTCWKYAKSLHQGEMNVLLSIQALDLGDFGLTICHLKNSLSAINQTLALLGELDHLNKAFLDAFRQEIRIRLFDLRELWIRVISDCRAECQHRPGGEQE